MMRCKPGDLVVCVKGDQPKFIGRIFTVVGLAPPHRFFPYAYWFSSPVTYGEFGQIAVFADETLRPINGDTPSIAEVEALYAPEHIPALEHFGVRMSAPFFAGSE